MRGDAGVSFAALKEQDQRYIVGTYGRYPIALVRGEGARVWDTEGKVYLDFLGGIAVNALGHCHPAVVSAITRQAQTLIHTSNLYYTEPAVELARALYEAGGLGKSFFCNSGAEANEGAFKLARKYAWRKGETGRNKIVSVTHAFHGRTFGALAATPKPEYQEGFAPLPAGFLTVAAEEIGALDAVLDSTVAAVIVEPVQGEGGVIPLDAGYLQAVRDLCSERGALLIFDEIQCGMGRMGTFYAYQSVGVKPDILTMAKALGGGLPIGCFQAVPAVAEALQPGDHGTTFGANPVACAAALATVRTIVEEGLARKARELGDYFTLKLGALQARYPQAIRAVRGCGLLVAADLAVDARAVLNECHRRGLLANVTAGSVLRFLPPYIITRAEIDEAAAIVDAAIAAVLSA